MSMSKNSLEPPPYLDHQKSPRSCIHKAINEQRNLYEVDPVFIEARCQILSWRRRIDKVRSEKISGSFVFPNEEQKNNVRTLRDMVTAEYDCAWKRWSAYYHHSRNSGDLAKLKHLSYYGRVLRTIRIRCIERGKCLENIQPDALGNSYIELYDFCRAWCVLDSSMLTETNLWEVLHYNLDEMLIAGSEQTWFSHFEPQDDYSGLLDIKVTAFGCPNSSL